MQALFERYDLVRIVNLPDRGDRRLQISREMARLGITLDTDAFFPAFRPTDRGPFVTAGAHGCFLSHAAIVAEAAAAGQSVLVLEDDCRFHSVAKPADLPYCDIFYGGWNEKSDDGDYVVGSHCMGFSAPAVQALHRYLVNFQKAPADRKAMIEPGFDPAIKPGIDGAYVWFRRAHPDLTTAFLPLSYQRSSRSDVTPGRFDQIRFLRAPVHLARQFRSFAFR